jgi:predicted lipid-binding transport protein (Tim44 family)
MDSGFPYGDIIVFAAIAAFIILRYRAMLGEKSGRDPVIRPLQEFERVIQLPGREQAKTAPVVLVTDYGALTDSYAAMRALDKNFSPEEFTAGAKAAFEMVIEAFNEADHDTLKMLLSAPLYENFKQSLTEQKEQGRAYHATLVAITSAEVTEAKLSGNVAQVTVHFVSEQVILTRNANGDVIEGDPSHQQAVEDDWVFERTLTSADPAWTIIET